MDDEIGDCQGRSKKQLEGAQKSGNIAGMLFIGACAAIILYVAAVAAYRFFYGWPA